MKVLELQPGVRVRTRSNDVFTIHAVNEIYTGVMVQVQRMGSRDVYWTDVTVTDIATWDEYYETDRSHV